MLESGSILPLKLLLKEVKPPEKVGSIIIAPQAKQPTITGEIVLIGDIPTNSIYKKMKINIGDKVLHSPHSFVELEIEGTKYRLLNIQDCLFIW